MNKQLLILLGVTVVAFTVTRGRGHPAAAVARSPSPAATRPTFALTDASAERRAMETTFVTGYIKRNPDRKFFCTAEMQIHGGIEVYFGMDCEEFTSRQAALLVTPDGQVYRNTGYDFADKDWVEIQ